MEQIIFDFLRLEDDIVDDLCRDFPLGTNFQRYNIARSVEFEVSRIKDAIQNHSQISCDRAFEEAKHETEATYSHNRFDSELRKPDYSFCVEKDSLDLETMISKKSNPGQDYNFSNCLDTPNQNNNNNTDATSTFDNGKRTVASLTSQFNCKEFINNETINEEFLSIFKLNELDGDKPSLKDRLVTKTEVSGYLDDDHRQQSDSRHMRVKIDFIQDIDLPLQDGGITDKSILGELGMKKSKTTKIKLRVPKKAIDSKDQDTFNKQVATYLSRRISSGGALTEGELLNWTY